VGADNRVPARLALCIADHDRDLAANRSGRRDRSVAGKEAYAVVPGLANVDSRFGMNSSFFLFGALAETVRISAESVRLAAGLLFLPVIVQGILTLHAVTTAQRKMDLLQWFQVLMIPAALWQARQYSSALSPDGVMFVLTVVITGELIRILRESENDYRIFGLVLLAVVGVTVKVSFVIFGGVAAAIALWKWSQARKPNFGALARVTMLPILVAALWMIHGVMLSGYIAYPSPLGSFPVDWRVPPSVVKGQAEWMVAWARSPGMHPRDVIGKYDWLARWVANTMRDRDVIGAALTLALAALVRIARPRREQPNDSARPNSLLFLIPSLLALIVWFVTAPAIRLTLGPLWVVAVGTLALAAARSSGLSLSVPASRIVVNAALVLVLSVALAVGTSESGGTLAEYPVRGFTTSSGLVVYVPVKGDRCGDAPLPCSSLPPNEGLELRHPGTIAKGFRVGREVDAKDYLRTNTPTGSANDARK